MVRLEIPMSRAHARGATLLEVLITTVIIAIGLLAIAGLQARLQISEMESYQRAQALLLLNDMASRMSANFRNMGDYETLPASPLGVGMICASADPITSTRAEVDLSDWCRALQGTGEVIPADGALPARNVGAMVGARGCIEEPNTNIWLITVVWQGLTPVSAPPAGVACGAGLYNGGAGNPCVDDLCRRYVTTIVRTGVL
jgi:type IV pilus assembly protein PilV